MKTIGNGVVAVQGDVASLGDLDKLYAEVSQKPGKIDVLFVNAGVAKFAPIGDTSESLYNEQFDINVKGAYFTICEGAAVSEGRCVDRGEDTSVAGNKGNPGTSAYSSTACSLLVREHSGGIGGARHSGERRCARTRITQFLENGTASGSY